MSDDPMAAFLSEVDAEPAPAAPKIAPQSKNRIAYDPVEVGGAAEARREDVGGVRGEALVDGRRRVVGAGPLLLAGGVAPRNLAAIGVRTAAGVATRVRIVRIFSSSCVFFV